MKKIKRPLGRKLTLNRETLRGIAAGAAPALPQTHTVGLEICCCPDSAKYPNRCNLMSRVGDSC